MIKKLIVLSVVVFSLNSISASAQTISEAQISGVVTPGKTGHGKGFLVYNGMKGCFFATARHVASQMKKIKVQTSLGKSGLKGKIISSTDDVALLEVKNRKICGQAYWPKFKIFDRKNEGEQVFSFGKKGIFTGLYRAGSISFAPIGSKYHSPSSLVLVVKIPGGGPGKSGSALKDKDGNILGILSFGGEGIGRASFASTVNLLVLMRNSKVPYQF